jgi:hypothetical protein
MSSVPVQIMVICVLAGAATSGASFCARYPGLLRPLLAPSTRTACGWLAASKPELLP